MEVGFLIFSQNGSRRFLNRLNSNSILYYASHNPTTLYLLFSPPPSSLTLFLALDSIKVYSTSTCSSFSAWQALNDSRMLLSKSSPALFSLWFKPYHHIYRPWNQAEIICTALLHNIPTVHKRDRWYSLLLRQVIFWEPEERRVSNSELF